MALHIRAARADDVDAVVPLIFASGPAAFDYVFARADADARAFLRHAFIDGAGEFGYRHHVVGAVGGRIVAAGTAFGREESRGFTPAAARQIVGYFGWRAAGPIARGLRTERVIRPPAAGEHYLAHLGVVPKCRGHGFGTALVEFLVRRGRELGRRYATLDVALDNPRAEALYARLGFRVTGQRASALVNARGAVPTQRRMRLDLA